MSWEIVTGITINALQYSFSEMSSRFPYSLRIHPTEHDIFLNRGVMIFVVLQMWLMISQTWDESFYRPPCLIKMMVFCFM
jgi:hypothetical protein